MTARRPQQQSTLNRRRLLIGTALLGVTAGCSSLRSLAGANPPPNVSTETFAIVRTDAQWRQRLTSAQYEVLRAGGTEAPFSSALDDEHRTGVFGCAGCALDLFSSTTKFDSGTGWPSFYQARNNAVLERNDGSLGMSRTEVLCHQCGSHLGHVFDDGPKPTGLRYCMNGVALTFRPA